MALVVIVDPDPNVVISLTAAVANVATTRACCDFITARHVLGEFTPDLLVTNARLDAYNGLHLAYLVNSLMVRTRTIVYSARRDLILAREGPATGAFVDHQVERTAPDGAASA